LTTRTSSESVDVAIVGAGLAGLTAARDLLAGGKTVLVLEARNRVGGKVLNAHLSNGGITEIGAEFVGPTQDRVLSLIADLGLETFDTYTKGNNVLWENNTRVTYSGDEFPPVNNSSLEEVGTAQASLDQMAATINVSSPWTHPNAKEWDNITFGAWLDTATPSPSARFLLDAFTTSVFGAESTELSLLYVIAYIASAGNQTSLGTIERLVATANGAQAQRVEGGTQLIPIKLSERLGLQHIAFDSPVRCITKTSARYEVESNFTVKAKSVVIAMSPPLAGKIKFNPDLPKARIELSQKTFMGSTGKAIAVYKTPFWRNDNINAMALSDSGAVRATFDNSPADASFGAIMGFIEATEMRRLDKKPVAEVQSEVLASFDRYFGGQAKDLTQFVLQRWDNEEFSLGAPVALMPPGVLTRFGRALREPVEGIHFAGTETAEYWTGYMDGAIRSGERVAREILG
jgi:monoamine oxidase